MVQCGDLKNVALNAAGFAARDNSDKTQRKHIQEAIVAVRKAKSMLTNKGIAYLG